MKITKLLLLLCAVAVPLSLAGCTAEKTDTAQQANGPNHEHDHSHESGPHGGHLIELGDEQYHLEWNHDDEAHALTFYVLDGAAKNEVKIPAENLQINVSVGEDTKSFDVPAVRADGEDTTALFETDDEDLFALIEDESVKATIDAQIDGKPFQGTIEHHHHDH